jgi:hypothetical protein
MQVASPASTKPHRERPADFRAAYIALGWDGVTHRYRTNWRVIRRWVDEEGRDELAAARAQHVRSTREEVRSRQIAALSTPTAVSASTTNNGDSRNA